MSMETITTLTGYRKPQTLFYKSALIWIPSYNKVWIHAAFYTLIMYCLKAFDVGLFLHKDIHIQVLLEKITYPFLLYATNPGLKK